MNPPLTLLQHAHNPHQTDDTVDPWTACDDIANFDCSCMSEADRHGSLALGNTVLFEHTGVLTHGTIERIGVNAGSRLIGECSTIVLLKANDGSWYVKKANNVFLQTNLGGRHVGRLAEGWEVGDSVRTNAGPIDINGNTFPGTIVSILTLVDVSGCSFSALIVEQGRLRKILRVSEVFRISI
jgi:hypothetical protein